MKRFVFVVIGLLSLTFVWAQQQGAPDFKKIEKEVALKDSPFSYTRLFQRYQEGDSTFTIEECRYLYFGQVFQPNWSPLSTHNPDERYLLRLSMPDNLDTALAAIAKAENVLKNDPFNINVLMIAFYLSGSDLVNDEKRAAIFNSRLGIVLNAISSCGNGQSADDAFCVVNISHEYAVVSVLGLSAKSQALVGRCDVLTLQENEFGIEQLYFNIEKVLEYENRTFGGYEPNAKKEKKSKKSNK